MYTEKKSILVFSDWYLPGYRGGGPIRSLVNLTSALKHQFYIVTRNTDHDSEKPYEGIIPNQWIKVSENVHVIYLEKNNITAKTFKMLLLERSYDRFYFNSLFSPKFTLLPLRISKKLHLQEKCVLAPRGMLKSGALSIKSRKKKIFLTIARLIGLFDHVTWHATNREEAKEILLHFPLAKKIRVSPNLSSTNQNKPDKLQKKNGELKLVCIARISPEKGILEAVKFLQNSGLSSGVVCDFYGTRQNSAYLEECEKAASEIKEMKIQFCGEISPESIPDILSKSHFFYMPTLGENFGHAISEAMMSGTPVIISDRTPWRDLTMKHAGWDLPLNVEAFGEVLNYCYKMENTEYQKWSQGSYDFGMTVAQNETNLSAAYQVFELLKPFLHAS